MSLQLAAKHLEAHGRGEDSHLVHMTTGELQAMQKLAERHGGSLTINPQTGLPEAGFLSSFLPMALGVAGAAFGLDPLLVAGGIGAADYAMTGSLGQGLMAGFGAYSGGNLGTDIVNFGSTGFTNAGDQAVTDSLGNIIPKQAPTGVIDTSLPSSIPGGSAGVQLGQMSGNFYENAGNLLQGTGGSAGIDLGAQGLGQQGVNLGSNAVSSNVLNEAANAIPAIPASTIVPQSPFMRGLNAVKEDPFGFIKKNAWDVGSATVPSLLSLARANQPKPYTLQPQEIKNPLKLNSPDFQGYNPQGGAPYYQPQYTNYVTNPYMAKRGGLMDVKKYAEAGPVSSFFDTAAEAQKTIDRFNSNKKLDKLDTEHNMALALAKPDAGIYQLSASDYANSSPLAQHAKHNIQVVKGILPGALGNINPGHTADPVATSLQDIASSEPTEGTPYVAAKGGIMHGGVSLHGSNLGSYSDGGHLLKGPGDGVSDSIPATIGGHQPARLAEGEFVIPARIVSELGNGSTDAGAKRLYEMMDRIKAKRAKAKDIAADTKAYKFLPA